MTTIAVTDETFEAEVLRAELPVLVDLHADWCAPCKQLAPIVAEVAAELAGKVKVCNVDVDRNPLIAQTFRVQSIPMLLVFHEGQLVGHQLGLVDKPTLMGMLEPFLPSTATEVKPEELARLLSAHRAVAVDVRDAGSFGRAHIPGAMHVTVDDIRARAGELAPRDGRIRVLYGRSSEEAKAVAEEMRASGVEVGYLSGGFLHWEADGLPVERG